MRLLALLLTCRRGLAAAVTALPVALVALGACVPPADYASQTASAAIDLREKPADLEFIYALENTRDAPYFPVEGIAGVVWGPHGSLYFCDEVGGRVHGWSPRDDEWIEVDRPHSGNFRPIDLAVDGFSLLVLDFGEPVLMRYNLKGVLQDQMLNFEYVDPGFRRKPVAMAVDVDGRLVFTDVREQQVFLVDALLEVEKSVGEAGSHREQFNDPSGVAFLENGGFVVADRGNRRLQYFNRLGYWEGEVGGEFAMDNFLMAPQGMATDDDGNLFVADPLAGAVHVLAPDLRRLFSIDSRMGLLAGPETPVDVAVGPEDLLAVSDRGRQAVLVYRIIYR